MKCEDAVARVFKSREKNSCDTDTITDNEINYQFLVKINFERIKRIIHLLKVKVIRRARALRLP